MNNISDNSKYSLEAIYSKPVSEQESLESWNNLSGFLSTPIEINNETKVVKMTLTISKVNISFIKP